MNKILLILILFCSSLSQAQNDLDSSLLLNSSIKEHVDFLTKHNCYRTSYEYMMPILPPPKPINCDSVRQLLVDEFFNIYPQKELFKMVGKSENYYLQLATFEAFSRSPYNTDTIVQFLDSLIKETQPHNFFPDRSIEQDFYNMVFAIVSPLDTYFPRSVKIDLESFTYINLIIQNYYQYTWLAAMPSSFVIVNSDLDFGEIDLQHHTGNPDKFELRGKIIVQNVKNKTIVIAPYYGKDIEFDQLSYQVPAQSMLEINFRCGVNISDEPKNTKRTIKLVNYITKEEKLLTFKASFKNTNP